MEAPRAAIASATRRQARMPSFSGTWPRMVRPALSSPPNAILSARLGRGVNHLRSGDAARGGHVPVTRFDQIIVGQREDLVGGNPRAIAIDDAETVGVAVGCKP